MKIKEVLLFIILLLYPWSLSQAETTSTLLTFSQKTHNDTLSIKLSFSSLPEYELHQFPSIQAAVVKFPDTTASCNYNIHKIEGPLVRNVRIVADDDVLRVILSLSKGVRLRVYPLALTKEVVIEVKNREQGVEYLSFISQQSSGRVRVDILSLNLNDPKLSITPVLARDSIPGLERTSSMVERLGALAGINGGYFSPNGDPLGLLIIGGEMVSEPLFNRTAIGYTKSGEIVWGNVGSKSQVRFKLDGKILDIDGINREGNPKEVILYTPLYGEKTRRQNGGIELSIVNGSVSGISSKNATIPKDGYVISLPKGWQACKFSHWDEIEIICGLPMKFKDVLWAIGGGPRLVKDGRVCITSEEERFRPDVAQSCTARSAIGVTFDGRLLFVSVGQGEKSRGMRLEELAKLMVEFGVKDGMNLDGGSSSTLVYRDRVVSPLSNGWERPVASALLVFDQS